jgi:two-component system, cell cycle response regulator
MSSEFDNVFAPEDVPKNKNTSDKPKPDDKWKIIIADDEPDVHSVTKMALKDISLYGKSLEFHSTYSGKETVDWLKAHPDTALILLDVVMESDDAGLLAVKKIREELNNNYVRIILRTGQPGKAPERKVIMDYDINDYLAKSETTSEKLFTTVIASLRAFFNLAEISQEISRTIINSAQIGIMVIDSENHSIVEANPTAQEMVSFSRNELIGNPCRDFLCHDEKENCPLTHSNEDEQGKCERTLKNKYGQKIPVLKTAVSVTIGGKKHYVETFLDISERKRMEENLRHLAYYDSMTNLPNRMLFTERLAQELKRAIRYQGTLALLFVDLNGFKQVNDTFGHHIGDLLLIEIGGRLQDCVRTADSVARLGGDEFAIILSKSTAKDNMTMVANRIIKALEEPFILEGKECLVGASIGISRFPEDGEEMDTLLMKADTAMYRAKDQSCSCYRFYDEKIK